MTVPSAPPYAHVDIQGDGSTVLFYFPYVCYAASEIYVQTIDSSTTPPTVVNPVTSGLTINGTANESNWTVTFATAPTSTQRVIIDRIVVQGHSYEYPFDTAIPSEQLTADFDEASMQQQQVAFTLFTRGIQFGPQEPIGTNNIITSQPSARANLLLGFDANGNITTQQPNTGTVNVPVGGLLLSSLVQIPNNTILGNESGSTTTPYALTATQAKTALALQNVNNTSDANKPVSTAQQTAINACLQASNNLSDVASQSTAQTNLAVYSKTAANSLVYGRAGDAGGLSFRNRLINGNFDVWQRGTSFSNPGYSGAGSYTADRWCANRGSGVNNMTVAQISPGSSVNGATYGVQISRTSGDTQTNNIRIAQMIHDNVTNDLVGDYITVTFWAKCGSSYSPTGSVLTVQLATGTSTNENDITSGGFTGRATPSFTTTSSITLTTSWQKFSLTTSAVIASTVTEMAIEFFMNPTGTASSSDNFSIAQVKVEAGQTDSGQQLIPMSIEMLRCYRYFYQLGGNSSENNQPIGLGVAVSTNTVNVPITLPFTMRTLPTLTAVGVSGTNLIFSGGITSSPSAVSISQNGFNVLNLQFTSTATTGTVGYLVCNSTSTPAFQFSAEI